jgi:transposase
LRALDIEIASVGLEAGPLTQYLTYGLQEAGFEVICMESRRVKAIVDDPNRFRRSRTVAAHFGPTPRRRHFGEMYNAGRISRAGDPDVRRTLYNAAHAIMTRGSRWSSLKAWGTQLAKTRGHRRAVVAVARKLAVIMHRMWLDETPFRCGTEGVT